MMMTEQSTDAPSKDTRQRIWLALGALLILVLGFFAYQQLNRPTLDLRALLVEARDAYHEPWASVEEAATALQTSDAIIAFVSQRIATSFYEGRLQNPETVLETRVANPADKAMLLQALLAATGVETRALAAPLTDALRAQVLESASATPIALPPAMAAIMDHLGYDDEALAIDQMADALTASYVMDQAEANVARAATRADQLLDLDGPSLAPQLPLDWVWLEASDGTVYDPILPGAPRSDLARLYTGSIVPTTITVTARDRFGVEAELVSWTGNAFGQDVNLAFLPTINMVDRLAGAADTADIGAWTPAIVAGEDVAANAAVTLQGDVLPTSILESLSVDPETLDISGFVAPQIENLTIQNVDASQFPRVQLGLGATVQTLPNWHAAHFNLRVGDERRPVRIEAPFATSTDVIIVHDQSGSMREQGRAGLARTFGRTLLDGLSATQRFAVIAHNDAIRVRRLFDPIEDVAAVAEDARLWDLPVRGTSSFTEGLDYALNAIEIDLGSQPQTRTSIVMVSDGESALADLAGLQEDLDALAERAQALNASIYPIILSPSAQLNFEDLASSTGGQLFRVASEDRLIGIANNLARRLAGGMTISFEAPTDPMPSAGQSIAFSLQVDGYDGTQQGTYAVPETLISTQPGVFVEISTAGLTSVRPLVPLGEHYDPNAMTGAHQIFLAPGSYPQDRMIAQELDSWILAYDVVNNNDEAVEAYAANTRLTPTHTQTVQGLVALTSAAMEAEQTMRFPLAVLHHTQVETGFNAAPLALGEAMPIATTLDVAPWSTFLAEPASQREVARIGLALNDAEARLLGDGINLTEIFATSPQLQADEVATNLLRAPDLEQGYWQHDPDLGTLYGFLDATSFEFKGSQDVVIAAKFKEIASLIDSYNTVVAPGVNALPTKALYSGIVAFKKEELKLWCYATVMLNYVNESIAGQEDALLDQSASAAQARAAQLCEIEGDPSDFGRRAAQAAASAIASAVLEEVKSNVDAVSQLAGAFDEPDVQAWVKSRLGTERMTSWIGDPTTRYYAEQLVGVAQSHVATQVRNWAPSADSILERLQQSGVGGGSGMQGGYPITSGLSASFYQALAP